MMRNIRDTSHMSSSVNPKLRALYEENQKLKRQLKIAEDLCRGEGGNLYDRYRSRINNKRFIKKYL